MGVSNNNVVMMVWAPARNGDPMQTITSANCPTTRIYGVDARDNRTYWVQKLTNGHCWMLTNLAYAGGGVNTYGDVKTIINSNTNDLAQPYYMIPIGANPTNSPFLPSTSTSGVGQYGYLYNWCAATGVQIGTTGCANIDTPLPDANVSICPAGWRLPTMQQFSFLNGAVNSGLTNTDIGLRTNWFGMYSGGFTLGSFQNQGITGIYWSGTSYLTNEAYAMSFNSSAINTLSYRQGRGVGLPVRCVIN
jgi:uncharacterized protein (TIGR02145 family)